jgi:hypothetical protein
MLYVANIFPRVKIDKVAIIIRLPGETLIWILHPPPAAKRSFVRSLIQRD